MCQICHKEKDVLTHHCSTCGVCIYRMDHHCVIIGKCVSDVNQKYFISYLFLVLLYTARVAADTFNQLLLILDFESYAYRYPIFFVLLYLSMSVSFLGFSIYMLTNSLYLICNNITQLEVKISPHLPQFSLCDIIKHFARIKKQNLIQIYCKYRLR